jgi:hypothetical protein
MAAWMAWDEWLERWGLRAEDWEPGVEYVRLDTWAEVLDEMAYIDAYGRVYLAGDPRLAEPVFAPLVAVLQAADELPRREGRGAQPGPRKVLQASRELAEVVYDVLQESRDAQAVAEILRISYTALYDGLRAHGIGNAVGRGNNPRQRAALGLS